MAEKLYLVRVDMENFIGPFSIKELGEAYRQLQFDLQDEIAGSKGEWVCFDDFERMKRHYPTVHAIIKRQFVGAWESGPSKPTAVANNGKSVATWSSKSVLIKVGYATLGLLFLSSVFLFLNESFTKNIYNAVFHPLLHQAQSTYNSDYNESFAEFMKQNTSAINTEINQKSSLKIWLPYLRAVAFHNNGVWPGLPARVLKGDANYSPSDCSLETWKRNWKSSEKSWSDFVEGQAVSKQWWARILFWDSDWITYRSSDQTQWLSPSNYYEACLMMAYKSLLTFVALGQEDIKANILSRLAWQMNASRQVSVKSQFEMFGSLWVLSCIESSGSLVEVDTCFQNKKLSNSWLVQLRKKAIIKKIDLLIRGKEQLRSDEMEDFASYVAALKSLPADDGLAYNIENQFFERLQALGGNIKKAKQDRGK